MHLDVNIHVHCYMFVHIHLDVNIHVHCYMFVHTSRR